MEPSAESECSTDTHEIMNLGSQSLDTLSECDKGSSTKRTLLATEKYRKMRKLADLIVTLCAEASLPIFNKRMEQLQQLYDNWIKGVEILITTMGTSGNCDDHSSLRSSDQCSNTTIVRVRDDELVGIKDIKQDCSSDSEYTSGVSTRASALFRDSSCYLSMDVDSSDLFVKAEQSEPATSDNTVCKLMCMWEQLSCQPSLTPS